MMTNVQRIAEKYLLDFNDLSHDEKQQAVREILAGHIKDMREDGRDRLSAGARSELQRILARLAQG